MVGGVHQQRCQPAAHRAESSVRGDGEQGHANAGRWQAYLVEQRHAEGLGELVLAAAKDGTRVLSEVGSIWYNLRGDNQETAVWHTFIGMPNLKGTQVGLPEVQRLGRRLADVCGHAGSPHHVAGPITGREFSRPRGFRQRIRGRCVTPSPDFPQVANDFALRELYEISTDMSSCLRSSCLRHDVCSPEQTDFSQARSPMTSARSRSFRNADGVDRRCLHHRLSSTTAAGSFCLTAKKSIG